MTSQETQKTVTFTAVVHRLPSWERSLPPKEPQIFEGTIVRQEGTTLFLKVAGRGLHRYEGVTLTQCTSEGMPAARYGVEDFESDSP